MNKKREKYGRFSAQNQQTMEMEKPMRKQKSKEKKEEQKTHPNKWMKAENIEEKDTNFSLTRIEKRSIFKLAEEADTAEWH